MGDKTDIEWCDATWNPVVGCSVVSPGCTNCYAMKMAARLESMSIAHERDHGGNPGGALIYRGLTRRTRGGPVWNGTVRLNPMMLDQPLRWKRPRRIFVNSMSDLFHESLPDGAIDKIFAVMALAPQHTFQVLTKRAHRMREYMLEKWQGTPAIEIADMKIPAGGTTGRRSQIEAACEPLLQAFGLADPAKDALWTADGKCEAMQWQWPLPNVWLGVSAEDQERADERLPHLLATPAAVRFVSAEPMLGPIDLRSIPMRAEKPSPYFDMVARGVFDPQGHRRYDARLDWLIVGGESGPGARPMHPDWARSIRDQCKAAGVPFFFKQWGEWAPADDWPSEIQESYDVRGLTEDKSIRVGKKRAGHLLDGREHREWPR